MHTVDLQTLDKQVALAGLMKRDYSFYILNGIFLLLWFFLSLFLVTVWDYFLLQLINCFFLWFIRLQAGLFAHDLSHQQVFKSKKINSFSASCMWSTCCWLGAWYWENKHNSHHKNTNQIGQDPDLTIPFAFDRKQLWESTYFFKKFILPYQHIIFFVALPFTFFSTFFYSALWLIKEYKNKKALFELFIIVMSFWFYSFFIFSYLSWYNALILLIGHLLVSGMYMGISFSPNHYGVPIIDEGDEYQRVYQIITSRNIKGKSITSFFLWGLNYQIEHHLYPTMPRSRYEKANSMVKEFCREHKIQYHQVGFFKSFAEIFTALKKVAKMETVKIERTPVLNPIWKEI